jgi:hypothetical protein
VQFDQTQELCPKLKHRMKKVLVLMTVLLMRGVSAQAQTEDTLQYRYFVGSTLFMFVNLMETPEPPQYYQLNLGYRFTPRDMVSLELITWRYFEPLGIPFSKQSTAPNFPGSVKAYGAGLSYQRFLWKRAYAQVHATLLHQDYLNEANQKIQSGIQLFNTVRVGYQFRFFKNRLFLEPSIAMTFWPVNTNLPTSFQAEEDKWNSFFLGEPGLHIGYNF